MATGVATVRVPFAEGFLTEDLSDLEQVRLSGSRCDDCRIALFGRRRRCESCASTNVRDEVFEPTGEIWSYTVQRYRPPGMTGAGDWVPRPIAWIDLDDGPRIIGAVAADPGEVSIGTRVRLVATAEADGEGREVVTYAFELLRDEVD